MKKKTLMVLVFFAVTLASSDALAFVHIEGRYWFTNMSDKVNVSNQGLTGSDINFTEDLGMKGKKNFWETMVSLELEDHQLRYSFMPLEWDGSRSISSPVNFNGTAFSGAVNSTLRVDYHRLGYKYDFIDLLGNALGVIVEFKYFRTSAGLSAPDLGSGSSRGLNVFFPAVGVAGRLGLPFQMNIGGEVTGMVLNEKQYMVDGEAAFNIEAVPFVTISGGYRILRVYLEKHDDRMGFNLTGPFVLLRAGF